MFRVRRAPIAWWGAVIALLMGLPAAAACEPHTLGEFVAFAREHAPRVESRQAERERARSDARARGFWLPEPPRLGGEWARRETSEGPEFHDRVFEANLALEPFGQGIFRARSAGAERDRDLLQVDAEARSWAADVAWRYCEYQRWRWVRGRVALQREVTRGLADIVQRRYEAGDASGLEHDLARVEMAEAELRELGALQALRRAEEALAAAVGWPAGAPLPAPDSLELVPALPDTTLLWQRAVTSRPELLVARAALRHAHAASRYASSALFPGAELGVFGGEEEGDDLRGLRAGLTLPFLGPELAERGARTAEERQLAALLRAATRDAQGEVSAARSAMALAYEGVDLYRLRILPGIDAARGRTQEAYALGEVDLSMVLLGEQRYRDAERSFAEALGAYVDALRDLEVSTGLPVLSGYSLTEENAR